MSAPDESFIYSRLAKGQIRLLYPSLSGGELVYRLDTVQLEDDASAVTYDALSYTWGDLKHTYPILCNGKLIHIHKNLRDALPFLARRRSPRPIWIDAICINQSDNIEKIDQVRSMHHIYRTATEVWVWLGCGSERTAEVVSLLPQFIRVGRECKGLDSGQFNNTPESQDLPPLSSPIWDAFYSLLHHHWFSRLWVVQEVALAKSIKVLCGHYEILWNDLGDAMDHAQLVNALHDADKRTTQFRVGTNYSVWLARDIMIRAQRETQRSYVSPRAILGRVTSIILAGHHCSDPRDRVFGVLGLVDEESISELGLVYDMELTELYTNFSRLLIFGRDSDPQSIWSLFNMATLHNKVDGLPSWCPDFHRQGPENCPFKHSQELYGIGILDKHRYNASKQHSHIRPAKSTREITLQGRIVSTIDQVFSPVPDIDIETGHDAGLIRCLKNFAAFGLWEKNIAERIMGLSKDSNFPTDDATPPRDDGDEQAQVYWRTLVGDFVTDHGQTVGYNSLCDLRKVLETWARLLEEVEALHADQVR